MMFGAVGGIIASVHQANRTSELQSSVQQVEFRPCAELTVAVRTALEERGYAVVGEQTKATSGLIDDYKPVQAGADALLDLSIASIGYVSEGINSVYRPRLFVDARLVSTQGRRILYADRIMYLYAIGIDTKVILPDPRFTQRNHEAMVASPASIAEGLRAGISLIAQRIGQSL